MRKYYILDRSFAFIAVYFLIWATACDAENLKIDTTGTVTTAYDDNITYVHTGRLSDSVTSLETGLELMQQGKTRELSIKADIIEQIFATHNNFDNTSVDFNLDYKQDLSRYNHIEFSDTLTDAAEPRSFVAAFGRTSGRYNTLINQTAFSFRHDFTEQISEEWHLGNTVNVYSRKDIPDSDLNQAGTKAFYTMDSATIYNVSYDYSLRLFEHGPNAGVNSLFTGVRRFFTPQFYVDLGVGPDFINSFADKNMVEPHYSAALTDQVNQNNRISLTFDSQDTTNAYSEDLFNSWRTAINGFRQISPRLSAFTNIFYGQGHYELMDLSEELVGVQAQLTYAVNQRTNLGAGYTFTDSISKDSSSTYKKNYFYISSTIIF